LDFDDAVEITSPVALEFGDFYFLKVVLAILTHLNTKELSAISLVSTMVWPTCFSEQGFNAT